MTATTSVLSGGGILGAVQVGMMRALAKRDEHADLLVGASAGALNAAFVGSHGLDTTFLDRLAAIWLRLDVSRCSLSLPGARPALGRCL